jgi:hypothetical protein
LYRLIDDRWMISIAAVMHCVATGDVRAEVSVGSDDPQP